MNLDHVERPQVPWRDERMTECGLNDRHPMITRREFYDRVKAQGQQRAALSICMTCWSTAQRHAGRRFPRTHAELVAAFLDVWQHDPVSVIERDVHGKHRDALGRELRVIAMLIDAHQDEFDAALRGLDETPSLADQRASRRMAARYRRGAGL